jgi:Zn finger protein HypA/HybF involved in hydrogenase expression
MEELRKGLLIDGVAATDAIDSQGERLSIEGADISALENGLGRLNDNHLKTFAGSIGRVTGAKKIFKAEECATDRQKMYWEKVQRPYIYFEGELYDDAEHPNAKAAAAIMKHLNKAGAPLSVQTSEEGSVLARKDGGVLDRTKVHSVALTFTPANKQTLAMPVSLEKSCNATIDWDALVKSVSVATDAPAFIETDAVSRKLIDAANKVIEVVQRVTELKKALSAGYAASCSPGSLVGGAVLSMPSIGKMYTNCTACGKKQIVRRTQTKCDHCGQSWTMEKIAKHLLDGK